MTVRRSIEPASKITWTCTTAGTDQILLHNSKRGHNHGHREETGRRYEREEYEHVVPIGTEPHL